MQPSIYEFWVDINLPQSVMYWLKDFYKLQVITFWQLGFTIKSDEEIFAIANESEYIIIITTKDYDFVNLVENSNSKTKVLHINTGNISNQDLKQLFLNHFLKALEILTTTDQKIVEII
jgi:predicted nuclease of predicted toxin-antitoxin system